MNLKIKLIMLLTYWLLKKEQKNGMRLLKVLQTVEIYHIKLGQQQI